jgi:hypothetical protein
LEQKANFVLLAISIKSTKRTLQEFPETSLACFQRLKSNVKIEIQDAKRLVQ